MFTNVMAIKVFDKQAHKSAAQL